MGLRPGGHLTPFDRAIVGPGQRNLKPFYRSYEDAVMWSRPDFTPTRTVTFTDHAGLSSAISGMAAGDLIKYTGTGVLSISTTTAKANAFTISGKQPSSIVRIDFGNPFSANYVKFSQLNTLGGLSGGYYGLYLTGCKNLQIFGGEYTGPHAAGGIKAEGLDNVLFWDFLAHDVGGTCISLQSNNGPPNGVTNCWFRGVVHHNGQDLSWDPHNEKGTGVHGMLTADSGTGNPYTGNKVALYAHDLPAGCGLEIGDDPSTDQLTGNTMWLKVENATKVATSQTAGNATNIWGNSAQTGNVYEVIIGRNLQGRVVDGDQTSTNYAYTFKHGRAIDTNQNSALNEPQNTKPFDPRWPNFTYLDCLTVI